jgi:uncharacterized membrane protein (UPF0127 family)
MKSAVPLGVFLFFLNFISQAEAFQKGIVQIGKIKFSVEIAENTVDRETGLMNRKSLGPNQGMLFIFENEQPLSFWMKNTLIDLDIGFFDGQKKLIEVKTMKSPVKNKISVEETITQSSRPARYALEMNAGWFKKNQIKVGSQFLIIRH